MQQKDAKGTIMMLFSLRACLSDRPSGAGCVAGLLDVFLYVSGEVGSHRSDFMIACRIALASTFVF